MADIYVLHQYITSEGIILYIRHDKYAATWSHHIVFELMFSFLNL